jgi:hypothetical protein
VHRLSGVWTGFADKACREYSPLYDRICRFVAATDDVLEMVEAAPPAGRLPNVLLAAVHYLVLGGLDHPLTDVYAGRSGADPGPLFVDVCRSHRPFIEELLRTRHTNTNEVGRSAAIGPALASLARRLGQPLGLVDVGCAAGLNLLCDRYLLDYGPHGVTGPPAALVHIGCRVVGGRPPIAARLPAIAARVGLDRDPVDVTDSDAVRWQLACVWPDTGRLPRTRLAFEEARRQPPDIRKGDAVDSLEDAVATVPADCLVVVVTTWALAYLTEPRRREFHDRLSRIGRRRPVAWVSGEAAGVVEAFTSTEPPAGPDGTDPSILGEVLFDRSREEATLLGVVHPHGLWLDWRGPDESG